MSTTPSAEVKGGSVEARIEGLVAEVFHRNRDELSEKTSFVKDLHAKSANIIELIALLEDEFGVEMPFAEVMRNDTVGAASQYIEGKLRSK